MNNKKLAKELIKVAKELIGRDVSLTAVKESAAEINDCLEEIEDALTRCIDIVEDKAREIERFASEAGDYGELGLISRQMESYMIGHLKTWKDGAHQIGSVESLKEIVSDTLQQVKDEEEEDEE